MNENRRVLHREAPSARTLIVSGLGALEEYLYAAAIALRARPGAELAFASRQALPDVLASRTQTGEAAFAEVLILGVGLSADPERLESALRAFHRKGAKVSWLSAEGFPVPGIVTPAARTLFEALVLGDDLPHAVAEALGGDAADLLEAHEAPGAEWRERLDAAGWNFANVRELAPLESLARDLARRVPPTRWDADAKRLVADFRAFGYRRLQTSSPAMRKLRKDLVRVAHSGAKRVLVTGESGVGKETVAQQIHVQSGRKGPFIAFNCATVAKDLLESRLFGHKKGAFTGAAEDRPGLFREADGGTLFLDEIGELPLDVQGLLLRALQEGRVMPVGEAREVAVDVRTVAATNRDLPELVREGRFREDLYWRLSTVELAVPPLRERKEDIRLIARELWRSVSPKRKPLADADLDALAAWTWPGNVRELANVLERAVLFEDRGIEELLEEEKARVTGRMGEAGRMGDSGRMVAPDAKLAGARDGGDGRGGAEPDGAGTASLDEAIRAHVRRVVDTCGGNLSAAARSLGVSRNTVRAHLDAAMHTR
ncbi:MAG: sigma-54-dependent Fis family transcriptional regulator [Kiritimatiellae bacterium]|nr:sigma-54-dependent Fis family transcriptional regulator [Kiritimatiellia bacterium]